MRSARGGRWGAELAVACRQLGLEVYVSACPYNLLCIETQFQKGFLFFFFFLFLKCNTISAVDKTAEVWGKRVLRLFQFCFTSLWKLLHRRLSFGSEMSKILTAWFQVPLAVCMATCSKTFGASVDKFGTNTTCLLGE